MMFSDQNYTTGNYITYTVTSADTTLYPAGHLVLAEPPPRTPLTEVEHLLGEVEAVCALAR